MITTNHFEDKLDDGRRVRRGQDDNGMHYGEITDQAGEVEAAITCKTSSEVSKCLEARK